MRVYVYVFLVRFFPEGEDVPDDAVVSEFDEESDGMLRLRVAAARSSPASPPPECGAAPRYERPKAEYGAMRELAALREREQVEQFLQAFRLVIGITSGDCSRGSLPSGPSALAPRATSRRPISNRWRDSFLLWDCAAASTHIPKSALTLKASKSESSAFSNASTASRSPRAMASRMSSGIIDNFDLVTLSVKPFPAGLESLKLHVTRRGILEMLHRDGLHLLLLAFNAENEQSRLSELA